MTEGAGEELEEASERPGWRDAAALDRRLSLALLGGAVALFLATSLTKAGPAAGLRGALGLIALVVAAKLGVLVVGVRQGWRPWPALAAEAVALVLVAWTVATRSDQRLWAVAALALFVGAVAWRRRVASDEAGS
jgi:drug/metabolite transporter (DMT)-like permease